MYGSIILEIERVLAKLDRAGLGIAAVHVSAALDSVRAEAERQDQEDLERVLANLQGAGFNIAALHVSAALDSVRTEIGRREREKRMAAKIVE